jgi:hypothetical protein
VPPKNAQIARAARAVIRTLSKQTTLAAIEIGRQLRTVKKILRHGLFEKWVQYDCHFSIKTAQNYMRLARFADKNESIALLPLGTAYRLTGKRVSPSLIDEVIRRAVRGERISEKCFEEMYRESLKRSSKCWHDKKARDNKARRDQRALDHRAVEEKQQTERVNTNVNWIVNSLGWSGVATLLHMKDNGTLEETLRQLQTSIEGRCSSDSDDDA